MEAAMSNDLSYWNECIEIAAEECGLTMTAEQRSAIAENVSNWHENYGMAFYSPPSSERYDAIEREWKQKYEALKAEFEAYRGNAEKAVHRAFRLHRDTTVSIGAHGSVEGHDGRSFNIQ